MPFVVSTSKSPTAVLGMVTGFFLGNDEKIVLLNRLNKISLFKEKNQSLEHLGDFPLFASLKFVEALPFFDSKGIGRHVAFLFSVKQEVSIVAFKQERGGRVELITLFYGGVDFCYGQQKIGEAYLCSSGVYRTQGDDLIPIVVLSIHCGSFFVFDAASAIASYSRNSKNASQTLGNIFPLEYTQRVFKKQKRVEYFLQGQFHASEVDVRRITIGRAESEKSLVPLFVLYSDSLGKTHVSEYSIDMGKSDDQRRGERMQNYSWISDASSVFPAENVFRRKGVLLANVETNACLLHVVSEGLFVIGVQLITFISRKSVFTPTPTVPSKNVTTLSFPSFSTYIEPVCCVSLPNKELLVCFWDGTYVKATLKEEVDGIGSTKLVLLNVVVSSLCTIPDSLAVLGEYCVVGSPMANTLWMKWRTGESGILVNHCGPVFDMTVAVDGPRMSVIASTGVGPNGGLSLVRSAVNVRHDVSIGNISDVKRISVSGKVIIFTFPGYSRICHCLTEECTKIEELLETPFDTLNETLALAWSSKSNKFYQVTTIGLKVVSGNEGNYLIKDDVKRIEHAQESHGLLIFSSSRIVFICNLNEPFTKPTLQLENEVSCLLVFSSNSFLIGEWGSSAVCLYEIHEGVVYLKGKFICSATPYSMCVLPHLEKPRLLIGLINGNIVDLALEDISLECSYHEVLLMTQPLQLFNLESHNSVLCLGEVPLIIILSDTGFQLTGIDFNDVSACAIIRSDAQLLPRYIFFSKGERALVFGTIVDLKKLNMNFHAFNATVTRVKYISWWNIFVLSLRRNEKDQIFTMMGHEITNSCVTRDEQNLIELLENERCVFIEPLVLGGSNERYELNHPDDKGVILIGTTFAFPDEQLSRSSRFMWYSVEQGRLTSERLQLRQDGSKDVEGALQCCCVVPNYTGRIALGINGCVSIYSWNSVDSTFVAEETLRVGTIVVRLVPLFQEGLSSIVAFDNRHSCFFLQVDTIQGNLSIVARDSELRGVMDGVVSQSDKRHDMCFGDDHFNFFSVYHDIAPSQGSSDTQSKMMMRRKLKTKAQYHLGDLITVMQQGSFAPCSVMNDIVPIPNNLIPGVCASQIVFGTSYGAFGTITPITNETYLFLKAFEVSVSAVTPNLGGFTHTNFREVLSVGQERGHSRNASFDDKNPKSAAILQERRKRYLSKCVCDADLIEKFLTLPRDVQTRVTSEAELFIKLCFASIKSSLEEFLDQTDLDHFSTSSNASLLNKSSDINGINTIFSERGLPCLPLTVEDVNAFIHNLERTH
ncbi:putative damage-specific DNA binding protein [Trypanosoma theileri]|uniref:Putative damage-specific DNA binding protein n=1 Tax=Trypanosoma theileri TaxID=67003 RepID=A0A1X0P1H9_9TRYP|nr:putative damage-specific DNA binding protein [Trypanosoma theileri]ORC90681.1 putative damage-specific DNA binding protein [Trypanosoma theileri]